MPDNTEAYRILFEAKTEEMDKAQKVVDVFDQQIIDLRADLDALRITQGQYDSTLPYLASHANTARVALAGLKDEANALARMGGIKAPQLTGADRAGAKAQLGLAAANIAQDAIQGGIGSTVNNFLGLAGNGKVMSLISEMISGAGGLGPLAAKASAVTGAFLALFGAIDSGLKGAGLGWEDFGKVVSELGPFKTARDAWAGLAEAIEKTGLSEVVGEAFAAVETTVGDVAELAVGWRTATDAAKAHKDEVAGSVKAAQDYAAAVKSLSKVQSDAQKDQSDRGELFTDAFANLGGKGGLSKILDQLAAFETARTGGQMTKAPILDDKGQPTGDSEDITRREAARRRLATDVGRAQVGDNSTMDRLIAQARTAGIDVSGLQGAAAGVDPEEEKKKADKAAKAKAKTIDDAAEEGYAAVEDAIDEFRKRATELSKSLQNRFNIASAEGGADDVVDRDQVQSELERAGLSEEDASKFAGSVLDELRDQFNEELRKRASEQGVGLDEANDSILDDARRKEAAEARRKGRQDGQGDRDQDAMLAQVRRNAEEEERRRTGVSKEALKGTGANDRVDFTLMRSYLGGASTEQAEAKAIEQLTRELTSRGQSADDARRSATEIVGERSADVRDEAIRGALTGKGPELQAPERIGVQDFARSVESGSAAEVKKQTDILGNMKDQLAELIRKTPAAALAGP